MTLARIDRRADHVIVSRPEVLGRLMDATALADEARYHLELAHTAKWRDDGMAFLTAVERVNRNLVRVGRITRDMAGTVEVAPVIPIDQLPMWDAAEAA